MSGPTKFRAHLYLSAHVWQANEVAVICLCIWCLWCFPSLQADKFSKKGNDHFLQQQYEEAIAAYSSAADVEPKNAVHFINRSLAQFSAERYEAALIDAKTAVSLKPDAFKAYVTMCNMCTVF